MKRNDPVLSLRLRQEENDLLQIVADERGIGRAEAARSAMTFGLPLVRAGHSFNITRLILVLEHLHAQMGVIISRDHPDVIDELLTNARERVEQFHA